MVDYIRENHSRYGSGRYHPRGSVTNYRALGNPNEETGRTPYAALTVHHTYAGYAPTFDNSEEGTISGLSDEYIQHKRSEMFDKERSDEPSTKERTDAMAALAILQHSNAYGVEHDAIEDKRSWAVEQAHNNPHIAPDKLFFETSPAKTQVASMFVDPSMKTSGINLLGVAYDDHNRAPIEADSSLTRFSSRLTQNAMKRGLPVTGSYTNPNAESTSDDADDPTHEEQSVNNSTADKLRKGEHPFYQAQPIADLGLIRGKEAVREMLGKTRNTKPVTSKGLSDQFLPGMEGFV
jgi:hypothetical protein